MCLLDADSLVAGISPGSMWPCCLSIPLANPVYDLALGLAVVAAPGAVLRSVKHLLYLDTRTRLEGLDLCTSAASFNVASQARGLVLAVIAGWCATTVAVLMPKSKRPSKKSLPPKEE